MSAIVTSAVLWVATVRHGQVSKGRREAVVEGQGLTMPSMTAVTGAETAAVHDGGVAARADGEADRGIRHWRMDQCLILPLSNSIHLPICPLRSSVVCRQI